jgi:hypothetical protein
MMASARRGGFRLWPWRQDKPRHPTETAAPTTQEVAEKLTDLMHFERGVAALYYYLPDPTLAALAERLCHSLHAQGVLEPGVDRDLRTKEAGLESWDAVSAIWHSTLWQPHEILATYGFRIIEALRAQQELWNVIVDPRAQGFGLAVNADEERRYRVVLVVGQKGQDAGGETTTAAR